jgi:hypothetical protein
LCFNFDDPEDDPAFSFSAPAATQSSMSTDPHSLCFRERVQKGKVKQAVEGKSSRVWENVRAYYLRSTKVNHNNLYIHSFSLAKVLKINDQTACTIANGFAVNESEDGDRVFQDLWQRQLRTNSLA